MRVMYGRSTPFASASAASVIGCSRRRKSTRTRPLPTPSCSRSRRTAVRLWAATKDCMARRCPPPGAARRNGRTSPDAVPYVPLRVPPQEDAEASHAQQELQPRGRRRPDPFPDRVRPGDPGWPAHPRRGQSTGPAGQLRHQRLRLRGRRDLGRADRRRGPPARGGAAHLRRRVRGQYRSLTRFRVRSPAVRTASSAHGILVRVTNRSGRRSEPRTNRSRLAAALAVVLAACGTAACSSLSPAASPREATSRAAPSAPVRSPSAQAAPTPTPTPTPVPQVVISRVRAADGSVVTVAAFRGPVQYVLHNGSEDPGPAAAGLVRAGPAVTGAERRRLLAAFNGGFELSAGAGGYEQEGHVIVALRPGQARIGIWGSSVPALGEAVYSVRQNLQPLVYRGQPTAASADPGLWGATLGGGEDVARSAVGQDSYGDLLFAGSMAATPADLAAALASRGARIAMELDINPEWVQLDVAAAPGGPLTAAIPGQSRPPNQYVTGWTRDFFAVLG